MKNTFLDRVAEWIELPKDQRGVVLTDKVKWAEIKNGEGRVTGYIKLFWAGRLGWVNVPGASLVIDSPSEPS